MKFGSVYTLSSVVENFTPEMPLPLVPLTHFLSSKQSVIRFFNLVFSLILIIFTLYGKHA